MKEVRKIWIISLFPELLKPFFEYGIGASAFRGERGHQFEINFVQLRDYSTKNYKGVDDTPYGGGPGMVLKADILEAALLEGVVSVGNYNTNRIKEELTVIYPNPRGIKWDNKVCRDFANRRWKGEKDLVFICGRYEGIDERFIEQYVDEQYSLGDYILTGGELAVMTILDSSIRFVEGSLGNKEGAGEDSFENFLLEHPQYTRPSVFNEMSVPEVLLSGNHEKIKEYQDAEKVRLTKKYRKDLFNKYLDSEKGRIN